MVVQKWLKKAILAPLFFAASVGYAEEPVSKSFFGNKAINGYDTAAYHSPQAIAQHKAVKGNSDFVVKWKGANWQFSNADSAQKFRGHPTRYSPAYNSHCANALSLNEGLIEPMALIGKFLIKSYICSMPLVAETAGSMETGKRIKLLQTLNGNVLQESSQLGIL